jgi:class 3 adenylate cyclase
MNSLINCFRPINKDKYISKSKHNYSVSKIVNVLVISYNLNLVNTEGTFYYNVVTNISKINAILNNIIIPDIIVLDINYYNHNKRVLSIIMDKYSHKILPIILVGDTFNNNIIDLLGKGINDYIIKPFKEIDLTIRIKIQLKIVKSFEKIYNEKFNLNLLNEILPYNISEKIKNGDENIFIHHPNITCLFSDIVGFTKISSSYNTEIIIKLLNDLFTGFDMICEVHKVFKVETIGDAYMIIAGNDGDPNHSEKLIDVAMDMIKIANTVKIGLPLILPSKINRLNSDSWFEKTKRSFEYNTDKPRSSTNLHNNNSIHIRIGINTGSAHSGIVGHIRPRYCFFGDTINTASRMESTSYPNCIQISDTTYKNLRDKSKYKFTTCENKFIKGKGYMKTHFINYGGFDNSLLEEDLETSLKINKYNSASMDKDINLVFNIREIENKEIENKEIENKEIENKELNSLFNINKYIHLENINSNNSNVIDV